jgi:hypothetical protein
VIWIYYTSVFLSNEKETSIKPVLAVKAIFWATVETRESADLSPVINAPTNKVC